MNNNQIYKGYWQIPGVSQSIQGELKINSSGISTLSIVGSELNMNQVFPSFKSAHRNIINAKSIPLIIGTAKDTETNTDTNFSLHDCEFIMISRSVLIYVEIHVHNIFTNCWFNNLSQLKFQNAFIKYSNVDKWADVHGFSFDYEPDKEYNPRISYKQPDPITLCKTQELEIELYFRARNTAFAPKNGVARIEQQTYINVTWKRKRNLGHIKKIAGQLQDFLSFVTGEPVKRLHMEVRKDSQNVAKRKNINHPTKIALVYSDSVEMEHQITSTYYMMAPLKELQSFAPNALFNWFNNYNTIGPVLKLYFDSLYAKGIHPETLFLNYCFSLEAYHRKRFPKESNRKENRQSLIDRLCEISHEFRFILKLIGIRSNSKFFHRVANTRNHMCHYFVDNSNRILETPEELMQCNYRLRILVEAILLQEIGFNKKLIAYRIQQVTRNWTIMKK